MIGEASALALAICGGSAWSGRFAATRLTASRTSLAAASRSRSRVKVMVICERPSRDELLTRSMPWIPATWRSMHLGDPLLDDLGRGPAIAGRDRDHGRIDAGQFADRQAEEGGQADDRQDDRHHQAKTGRRTAISEKRSWPALAGPVARPRRAPCGQAPGVAAGDTDGLVRLDLVEPVGDDQITGLQTGFDLD